MNHKIIRILLSLLTGFVALTAIGGGVALLVGVEGNRFPLEWLRGTPFGTYTVPALILAGVVGGSALVACITLFTRPSFGWRAALVSGILMMGFIAVEVLILQQEPPGPTLIEWFYFGLGLVIAALATYHLILERPNQSRISPKD
jgi:hypothetical protein